MKKFIGALLALVSAAAFGAVNVPVQMLNPTGSTAGQAVISMGPSTAPTWGSVSGASLAAQAANTVLANATAASASPIAFAMPSCSTSSSALDWTTGTGFTCNTSINAASLGGNAASTYAPLASPTFTGTPAAPTAAVGTSTTQLATTAFVAAHNGCRNIMDYGGSNNGSGSNNTALSSAISAGISGQACVYFPPGNYAFSANFSYSLPSTTASLTLVGDGADITNLSWAAGGGMTLSVDGPYSSVHVRNMSFLTGTTNTGTGLALTNQLTTISNPANTAQSDITGVTFRGSDGYAVTDYWSKGVSSVSVSNINFINDDFVGPAAVGGQGVNVSGTSTAILGVANFTGCTFNWLTSGILYGAYAQGVSVVSGNFVADTYGINIPSGEGGLAQLTVASSQFNDGTSGILDASGVPGLQVIGNIFIVPYNASAATEGLNLSDVQFAEIIGNQFGRSGAAVGSTNGVQIGTTLNGGAAVIMGNTFSNLATGINLTASSSGNNVQANVYHGNTGNVNNAGTSNSVGVATQ